MLFVLIDDGTLDTVVQCETCGGQVRFDSTALVFEWGEDGRIDGAMLRADTEHDCEEYDPA